ncbi:MAG: hypothetical protein ABIQ31_22840, partial [Ferruginibacter sp.]
ASDCPEPLSVTTPLTGVVDFDAFCAVAKFAATRKVRNKKMKNGLCRILAYVPHVIKLGSVSFLLIIVVLVDLNECRKKDLPKDM